LGGDKLKKSQAGDKVESLQNTLDMKKYRRRTKEEREGGNVARGRNECAPAKTFEVPGDGNLSQSAGKRPRVIQRFKREEKISSEREGERAIKKRHAFSRISRKGRGVMWN